jgi:hypothetical protein
MGYLRKNSFLIFSDENAPTEVKELDAQEVAKIEAAHQEGKKQRVDELILQTLIASALEEEFASGSDDEEKAEEAAKVKAAGPEGQLLRRIVQRVQGVDGDEEAFKEFVRTDSDTREAGNKYLRDFAWAAFEITTSKAKLPDNRYVPYRSSGSTVRFKDDHRLGVNEVGRTVKIVDGKQVAMTETETLHDQNPTLWVKVADGGWAKDGNWGGYLQVTCVTDKGKWIDSSDGWVTSVASKSDKVTFYDMGNYYEIWQKDRKTGRPLIVQDDHLRFAQGATPGKFNLQDSTWD